jgi:hypothetical protein
MIRVTHSILDWNRTCFESDNETPIEHIKLTMGEHHNSEIRKFAHALLRMIGD